MPNFNQFYIDLEWEKIKMGREQMLFKFSIKMKLDDWEQECQKPVDHRKF